MESVEAVEKILNYTFTDKNLLKEAITKTSGSNTESSSLLFERLEFLGDSVLLVVFTNHIEITYPNLHPNDLNDVRIANVSNETFARVAVNNNLHQFIIFEAPNPLLHKMIKDFSEAVKEEVYPAPCGGLVKAPKFLANLVEAIAGAVYIDVDFDVQRVWEIFRVLVEPICTLDDLRKQPERTYLRLLGLGDKLGKRIEVLYTKAKEGTNIHVFKVYLGDLLIACGSSYNIDVAKLNAANKGLHELSKITPVEKIVDEDSLSVEPEDVKRKSLEICSAEKLRLQTVSSSLPTASENPLTNEMTQEQMVIDEDSPHVESDDVKRKLFEICSPEKLRLQTESSSLPTASENPLEQTVIDEDSPHVEPEDAKGKLTEIYSTRKLQIQTGSSSLPTASPNPLTYEMTIKQMVVEDGQEEEANDMTLELFQICENNKWPNPIFSFEEEGGAKNEQKFVCSVNIEIPSVESIFHMKGDAKSTKTQAQNSSAYYMIGALKSSLMSHVKSNLPIEKSLDEKISSNIEILSVESIFHMKGDAKSTKEQAKNSSAYYMIGALKSSLMSHVKSNLPIEKSLDEKISSNESCLPHERSLESLSSEIDSDPVNAVEKILNYSFTNKNLLREALTHNSSNLLPFQRLIFVGKAGISLAFANHMYLMYPKLGPKELTMLQNANTCNDRYARVAVKRGIYQFLKCNVPRLERQIIEFIKMMGKEDDPDPFRSVKAPKILTDLVESVAGAVYIDVNRDVKRLWEILRGLFEPMYTLDDIRRKPHPLLTLFCLGYKHGKRIEFRYRECEKSSGMNEATITEVYVDDKFIACGKSCNRAASKMRAATMALEKLSESMPIELVMDDSIEYENSKKTLIEICNERKWPNPIFSVERSCKGFVSSVTIETPTEEGTLYIEGDLEKGKKKAEYNAASHVVRTLKASPLGIVVRNLKRKQISLDEEEIVVKENKDEEEILHRNKRKRRRR
ncbi:Double-stranded RNA-binding domain [Arabidopsis thaliana x Arabidopsis arenosa]|uniref:Double-stranded RNA-binding domain n=1 Tax=Arabidopsis thaliana x Arabidopsis arenosa TaxID=1240361 RepID=A0A8T2AY85_9BRAS|nr:Double-stranded RNA-binding domain [Arabidopsis thaliana x Arabidopsis arenosa]